MTIHAFKKTDCHYRLWYWYPNQRKSSRPQECHNLFYTTPLQGHIQTTQWITPFWNLLYLPPEYPRLIQATRASCLPHSSSQTVPHSLLCKISSRPSLSLSPPRRRTVIKKRFKNWGSPTRASRIENDYRKISNIRRTKSPNLNVSRLVLQLPLPNPMKLGFKSRMKM